MGRQKPGKPRRPKSTAWAALDGLVLNGGCSHCHAEIHVYVDTNDYSARQSQVRHDDDCPELALRRQTGATTTMILTPPKGMGQEEFMDLVAETCPEALPYLKSYSLEDVPDHLREVAALTMRTDVA